MRRTAREEWRSDWTLVLSAMAGASIPALTMYTFGLFIVPLEREFGWSRAQISSVLTLNAVVAVLFSSLIGMLADRIGPRRVAIPGILLYCAAIGGLSLLNGSYPLYLLSWLLIAICALFVQPTIWAKAVVNGFDSSRGLALALMLFGPALTAIFSPLAGEYLMHNFGWRATYVGIAAIWTLVTLPLVALFFNDGRSRMKGEAGIEGQALEPIGLSLKEGLRSFKIYKILAATLIMVAIQSATIVNFIPLVTQAGISVETAAIVASSIGFATMAGRLCTGFLVDRFNASIVAAIAFSLPVPVAIGLLVLDGSTLLALAIAAVVGLMTGAEADLVAFLVSRHLGMRHFGFFLGLATGMMSAGLGIGTFVAGFVYDRFGTYDPAIWGTIPLSLAAALMLATLGRYPSFGTAERNS